MNRALCKHFVSFVVPCLVFVGCGSMPQRYDELQPPVEQLYLNYQELDDVFSDILLRSKIKREPSNEALGRIHMIARLIQQANRIAYYQWALLSITEYIDSSASTDFFTLRMADLRFARDESNELLQLVELYSAFIRDQDVLDEIKRGTDLVKADIALYETLIRQLKPRARPAPFPSLTEEPV